MPFNLLDLDYCKRNGSKIENVNRTIEALNALAVVDVQRLGSTPQAQLAFRLAWYRGAVISRMRLLEAGASTEYNNGNFLGAAILVRQFIETAAHFIWMFMQVEKQLAKTPPGIAELSDKLVKGLMGSKAKGHSVVISPEQILNCIDAADKLLGKAVKRKTDAIRGHYDHLSEFVHPNAYAWQYHTEFSVKGERDQVKFHAQGDAKTANLMSGHIFTGMVILELFLYCEKQLRAVVKRFLAAKQ